MLLKIIRNLSILTHVVFFFRKIGNGYFMYLDSSQSYYNKVRMEFEYPIPNIISSSICIQFYYHMFAQDFERMGRFTVFVKLGRLKYVEILMVKGNRGDYWRHHRHQMKIPKNTSVRVRKVFFKRSLMRVVVVLVVITDCGSRCLLWIARSRHYI